MTSWLRGFLLPGLLLVAMQAWGESAEDLLALSLEELVSIEVSIATGMSQPIQSAPAIASVITARDLQTLGVQTMNEALETVPGLHVSYANFGLTPRYFIRGIASARNPETLVMVNGVSMTSLWLGDRLPAWQGVPVDAIERIEIIRGPGSALYGADAFAGVINIITKGPDDVHGGQASLSHGSFDTTRATLLQGGMLGPVRTALSLAYHRTEGQHRLIEADAQTMFDDLAAPFGVPAASLAPGPLNLGLKSADARLEMAWGAYSVRLAGQQVRDVQTGQGIADALDRTGRFDFTFGNLDLGWHEPERWAGWDMTAQVNYAYKSFKATSPAVFYPPGAFFGSFPQGVLDQPYLAEETARFEGTAVYGWWVDHRLRTGIGIFWSDLFETRERKNYDGSQGLPLPLPGGMAEFSDTPAIFQPEAQRTDVYAFVQDEWELALDWVLTAGLRYDHYSDFGDTTNPRLALVWSTTPTLITKLLYGEAFRAPAFSELYVSSNPVSLGNPRLRPEKLKSAELAFAWQPADTWALDINFYRFHIRDFITVVADPGTPTFTSQNVGRLLGRGVETEVRHQTRWPLQLLANYSYQRTEDETTGQALGLAPRDQAYARAVWDFLPGWQLVPQLMRVGRTPRQTGDARTALAGYTTVDLTLRRLSLPHQLELTLIGGNLFNADRRAASRGPGPGQIVPAIPHDLPLPGRTLTLEVNVPW